MPLTKTLKGGTSGIGASLAESLAARGAQLILLTAHPLSDPFLTDHIEDLRARTGNELVAAETLDLASLHSVRRFATKWIDNSPPRRLDMVVLCHDLRTPGGGHEVEVGEDGVEAMFAVNYLGVFQLLGLLSPALRAQPPDRDVRVVMGVCGSYMGGEEVKTVPLVAPQNNNTGKGKGAAAGKKRRIMRNPARAYASTKLAVVTFARAFQKHLSAYKRPDGQPMNARVLLVDPGFSRTPGMRRFLTWGSLWGLAVYLACWPVWWLVLKSAEQGAQTFLYAAMEERFGGKGRRGLEGKEWGVDDGVPLLKECREVAVGGGKEGVVGDEKVQRRLWEVSEKAVEALEKEGAQRRARQKADADEEKRKREKMETEGQRKPGSRKDRKEQQQKR